MRNWSPTLSLLISVAAASRAALAAPPAPGSADPRASLAHTISTLIRNAIPLEYEKRDDWGATKEVVVGLRATGNLRNFDIHRRRKAVNHGVWKHYQLRMLEPEKNLAVQLTRLESRPGGGVNFTLRIDARLDAWARAKAYEYGVHLIALELEGDARVTLEIVGEITLAITAVDNSPAIAVLPSVQEARLSLNEFHLRRVSNAKGPLVRELGDALRQLVEDEINGPALTAKLNRAIAKQRDRLVFGAGELLTSEWWPMASAPQPPPTPVGAP